MAALWPLSRIPQIDPNGDPYTGAKAYFYNVGTTTPQTVYQDSGLSNPHRSPVVANANGSFPAIYLNATPGSYRQRVTDQADVELFDDDGISVPAPADFVSPDAGSTDPTLLLATGDIVWKHGTGAISGRVRLAGRTIGSASSGATERANADCSALFQYLWTQDTTLAVSSGRGGSAASDFAANKTIALPDYRGRSLVALADMGNSASSLLSGVTIDNSETVTTLGATFGEGTHTLLTAEIPAHPHTASFAGTPVADHAHDMVADSTVHGANGLGTTAFKTGDGDQTNAASHPTKATSSAGGHTPAGSVTVNNAGGGGAHNNTQPSVLITAYMKT